MSIWAVIPAKSPHAAKTRLAPVLPLEERAALARRLLAGAVDTALRCPVLAGVIVVSAAEELRALAAGLGAHAYPDPETGDPETDNPESGNSASSGPQAGHVQASDPLNAAIALGCAQAAARGATAALILPADLPLLSPDVIVDFVDEAGDAAVALAPDRSGTGTNALLLRPPHALEPLFGPASFARHRAAARAHGLAVTTVHLPELAFDLDTPDDLARLCVSHPARVEVVIHG
jgi:2-phospho-L-lactate guanylyltransferase